MPEISIRMSSSSSTIRMSCAMRDRPRLDLAALRRRFLHAAPEHQADPRAAARRVLETQLASVVLHDLLDDRQPQPRAFGPRRDVGLGQPLPSLRWQAAAIVVDLDDRRTVGLAQPDHDLTLWQTIGAVL